LISVLQGNLPDQQKLNIMAFQQLDGLALQQSSIVKEELEEALASVRGTQEYLDLVERFELHNQHEKLLRLMKTYPDSSLGIRASRLSLEFGGGDLIRSVLEGTDNEEKQKVVAVLGNASTHHSIRLLEQHSLEETNDLEMRRLAIKALGSSWGGEQRLV